MRIRWAGILGVALLLTACGTPDASGIYVATSDHDATLIQLVQTPDGKVTARLQTATIGADGVVATKSGDADGSVSGNDLILRPASAWFGGLQASGTFTGSALTLTGQGGTVTVKRSTLDAFDKAVANLQSVAAERRTEIAGAKAKLNQQLAQAQSERETADRVLQVNNVTARINEATRNLNDGLARSPDFARRASDNTALIARMVERAPSLGDVQRGQLSVAANQVEVRTNQIEVARSQYADRLNSVVEDAKGLAQPIANNCSNNVAPPLAQPCAEAKAALTRFATVFQRGAATFKPQKPRVQAEIDRQDKLIARIDG